MVVTQIGSLYEKAMMHKDEALLDWLNCFAHTIIPQTLVRLSGFIPQSHKSQGASLMSLE